MPQVTFLNWLMALLPIVAILVLMVKFRWSGGKAGALSWFISVLIAYAFYGADSYLVAMSSIKGLWSTVFVLYIIWGAMVVYFLVTLTGAIDMISSTFSRMTAGNKLIQLLVLGWVFPSFVQGVLGFGMPVAITGPLLVGLGFPPPIAVATPLIGHSWSVTFGSLGSSYSMLVRMSQLDPRALAFWSAIFLGICAYMVGFSIAHLYGGWRSVREGLGAVLVIGTSLAIMLNIVANVVPNVASFTAGLVTLGVVGLLLTRTSWYRTGVPVEAPRSALTGQEPKAGSGKPQISFNLAFAPYWAVIIVVFGVYLTPLRGILDRFSFGFGFPEAVTTFGFVSKASKAYAPIKYLTAPGTMIFVSAFLGYLVYAAAGVWKPGTGPKLVKSVVKQAIPTTITLLTMSMMAVVMTETGMVKLLAVGVANFAGRAYAVFSPLIGVLGAFMTGSNTNSNLLFTGFQIEIAKILGISALVVCGMQTTGGAIGNMLCPMNVALGTGTTGITGEEGKIIGKTLTYGLIQSFVIGILGYILVNWFVAP
ncbi:MAG TPA: L-lactate permease [Firmicutes bacterium]|nr:L-lactate permease [Bacillota bacterium]